MEKAFIVLIKFSGPPDKAFATKLGEISTQPIRPLQFSEQALVIGMTWDGMAHQLWDRIAKARISGLAELMLMEAGRDWCGMKDRQSSAWLVKHLGDPLYWATDD